MRRLKLASAGFLGIRTYFEPFAVGGYTFYSAHPKPSGWPHNRGATGPTQFDTRSVTHNAYVEFTGRQEESILFRSGIVGYSGHIRKKKLIEDVLLITSLITGRNWWLYSHRGYPDYPVINCMHLNRVAPGNGGAEAGSMIEKALECVRTGSWRTQFAGGFHLRMLRNHANILSTEARYLSLMVIWEWLYAHLKNPFGATVYDESKKLTEILASVLRDNWPEETNYNLLRNKCILHVLRNQLAHSGRLPIDRKGADDWMKNLHCGFGFLSGESVGVIDYIHFFEQLTQVVVLRTLGLKVDDRLGAFSFTQNLSAFLSSGRIQHRC